MLVNLKVAVDGVKHCLANKDGAPLFYPDDEVPVDTSTWSIAEIDDLKAFEVDQVITMQSTVDSQYLGLGAEIQYDNQTCRTGILGADQVQLQLLAAGPVYRNIALGRLTFQQWEAVRRPDGFHLLIWRPISTAWEVTVYITPA